VTWNAATQDNECGLVFRYTPADTNAKNWTFYAATISRKGTSQAYVRDKKGYRNPLMQQQTSAIQSNDGGTNHLLVIGQGSKFRFYVNGTQVGTMVDDAYKTGSLALMGIRYSQSTGLVCKFSNVWAWSLQ
jgi:hypothetical protein